VSWVVKRTLAGHVHKCQTRGTHTWYVDRASNDSRDIGSPGGSARRLGRPTAYGLGAKPSLAFKGDLPSDKEASGATRSEKLRYSTQPSSCVAHLLSLAQLEEIHPCTILSARPGPAHRNPLQVRSRDYQPQNRGGRHFFGGTLSRHHTQQRARIFLAAPCYSPALTKTKHDVPICSPLSPGR
jgi:hypothetical protein